MAEKDLYTILGVSRSASQDEIKKAYRKLSMKWHPDRNPDNKEEAEARFKEINKAYEILSDSQKKATYDNFGFDAASGATQGGFNGFSGFSAEGFSDILGDVFGDIFGGGRRQQQNASQQQMRGHDLAYRLELTLEEAVNGVNKEIRVPTLITCKTCHGNGTKEGSTKKTCSTCKGSGQVRLQQNFFSIAQLCPTCRGKGQLIENPCDKCRGSGRVKDTRVIPANIPAGVDTGDRVRLAGQGEAGELGAPAGDLYIEIQVRKHAIFTREGNDLYCVMPIGFVTACLGGEIEVPTLAGRVKLTIPPETQTNKVFRLKGKGIRSVRSHSVGDLFCTVNIETPVNLSKEQKALLEKFDSTIHASGQRHVPKEMGFLHRVKEFFDSL